MIQPKNLKLNIAGMHRSRQKINEFRFECEIKLESQMIFIPSNGWHKYPF